VVRDHDHGQAVRELEYVGHPSAADVVAEVVADLARRHGPSGVRAIAASHRIGTLAIGDVALAVAVSAEHRAEAFAACSAVVDEVKRRLPVWKRQTFDDGTDECPPWATPYEAAAESGAPRVAPPWARSGDDLYLLYTGGTTGMPKGVMWRQDDLFSKLNSGNLLRVPEDGGIEGVRRTIVGSGPRHLPACPLMHGTGGFTAMAAMTVGGCVVTLTERKFDPVELLDTIDRENVNTVAIVGDAFAKPILRALEDLSRSPRRGLFGKPS